MTSPINQQQLSWRFQKFGDIPATDWYQICIARIAVFVVEQNCPYQELDGQDLSARHLSVWTNRNDLVAYLRILAPGERFTHPSIGRVLTTHAARGLGLGRPLMEAGIERCRQEFPQHDIELSAQAHLVDFYGSLGFKPVGETYLEDGIPHIDMHRAS